MRRVHMRLLGTFVFDHDLHHLSPADRTKRINRQEPEGCLWASGRGATGPVARMARQNAWEPSEGAAGRSRASKPFAQSNSRDRLSLGCGGLRLAKIAL